MVEVGDEIELSTKKVGQAPRIGTVVAIAGSLVTVRWPTGDQTTLVPAPGTMSVVRHVGGKGAKSKRSTKSAESKKAARKRGAGGAPTKKSAGKKRSR
jgi:hypothetical protein